MNVYENDLLLISSWILVSFMSNVAVYHIHETITYTCIDMSIRYIDTCIYEIKKNCFYLYYYKFHRNTYLSDNILFTEYICICMK